MPEVNQLRWLWLSWGILILDQFSKWFASRHLPFHIPVEITPFFNLTYDFNRGAAFSFLRDETGWQLWLFSAIALAVSLIIFIWLYRMHRSQNLQAASLASILGGAVGNMLDRLFHGGVIDFISWHYGNYYFPTFNIADSGVCIGAFLYLIAIAREKKGAS
jgi:signal peptidase II